MYNSLARQYFLKIAFSTEIPTTTTKKMDMRVTATVSLDRVHLFKKENCPENLFSSFTPLTFATINFTMLIRNKPKFKWICTSKVYWRFNHPDQVKFLQKTVKNVSLFDMDNGWKIHIERATHLILSVWLLLQKYYFWYQLYWSIIHTPYHS